MGQTETEERIAAFSSLADPTRRRLYLYTVSRPEGAGRDEAAEATGDRKSTRLNSSHVAISYAVFCLKKKTLIGTCANWAVASKISRYELIIPRETTQHFSVK